MFMCHSFLTGASEECCVSCRGEVEDECGGAEWANPPKPEQLCEGQEEEFKPVQWPDSSQLQSGECRYWPGKHITVINHHVKYQLPGILNLPDRETISELSIINEWKSFLNKCQKCSHSKGCSHIALTALFQITCNSNSGNKTRWKVSVITTALEEFTHITLH